MEGGGGEYFARIVHVVCFGCNAVPLKMLQVVQPNVIKRLLHPATISYAAKHNDGIIRNNGWKRFELHACVLEQALVEPAECWARPSGSGGPPPMEQRLHTPVARSDLLWVSRDACPGTTSNLRENT